ncbi:hypothetical protein HPB47_016972 [Ixodes persulcatus]|uniref:Uncharacterized protein n=1 Tax=Ixodes persulcatus TaxID=34615 RepID=A0AC60QT30_IXOPE|nr:hypothetical protein HPB47_016972 [Ixodes persulcatus]
MSSVVILLPQASNYPQLVVPRRNVTKFYFFAFLDKKKGSVYQNLIMEYVPDTMDRVILQYNRSKQTFPLFLIKLLMYQLLCGLAYINKWGICHRDINP